MAVKPKDFRPLFAAGVFALLAVAPPLAAGEEVRRFVAATSLDYPSGDPTVYAVDLTTLPPAIHGPFFAATFDPQARLLLLRDAAAGIVFGSGPRLHRIDFGNPESPSVVATATLPFSVNDLTRLADSRDELVAVGSGGQLAVIDPDTFGILTSFTLPSTRSRVRTSRDGRLLLTQANAPRMAFLASFDRELGPGPEVPMRTGIAVDFDEAIFAPDRRTAVLIDTDCYLALLGPPFCESRLNVYDVGSPAQPAFREEFGTGADAITSAVLDRAGKRLIFHRRGSEGFVSEHQLRPFTIAGPGELTAEPWVDLTTRGDFEASGLVRTAGAKRLLVFTSETEHGTPPVARLHHLDPVTGAGPSYPLPLPLDPRGVFHTGAEIFADGFESGTTGAWGPADL